MTHWNLKVGDRVVHFQKVGGVYPTGVISRVNKVSCFFPYWVDWDLPWTGKITVGAFQTSCFKWDAMERPQEIERRDGEKEGT